MPLLIGQNSNHVEVVAIESGKSVGWSEDEGPKLQQRAPYSIPKITTTIFTKRMNDLGWPWSHVTVDERKPNKIDHVVCWVVQWRHIQTLCNTKLGTRPASQQQAFAILKIINLVRNLIFENFKFRDENYGSNFDSKFSKCTWLSQMGHVGGLVR